MPAPGSTILVLANPISGRGRGRGAAEQLAEHLRAGGEDVALEFTRGVGHARARAAHLERDIGRLAVVGGDGTVNEVVSGLDRFDVPVAVLPTGTANLLGSALGLKRNPDSAAAVIRRGRIRRLDLGVAGDRRFVSVAGVGFDAVVARDLARRRRGPITKLSYLRPAVRALARHRPEPLHVSVDGNLLTENAAWVLVCNVRPFAAYFQFTPHADPTDGHFDLCVLNRHDRWSLVRLHLRAILHRPGRPPGVSYPRGRRIKIWSPAGTAPLELDGDFAGETPVEVDLMPAALPLLVP